MEKDLERINAKSVHRRGFKEVFDYCYYML